MARFAVGMSTRDTSTNADIEELIVLARSVLPPEAFASGLDDEHAEALLALHATVAHRFGARAASRACASLGGVGALQQLLKAMHKQKLNSRPEARLMTEVDEALKDTADLDRIRRSSS